jgi:hypothetical protein
VKIYLLFSFIFSTYCFADFLLEKDPTVLSSSFSGGGKWKENISKDQGDYTIKITIERESDSFVLREDYQYTDSSMSVIFRVKEEGLDFFSVLDENNTKIGDGFCFKLLPKTKVCQLSYSNHEILVTKSYHISPGIIKRVGSVKGESIHLAFSDESIGLLE